MVECKYPNYVTLALTEKTFKKLQEEMNMRHMIGDLSASVSDLILLSILSKLEDPKASTFPVFLDMEEIKREDREGIARIVTIVPCKECHEHPCTCKEVQNE